MPRSMVVPFDGSVAARRVLQRAVAAATRAPRLYEVLIVAAAGLDPAALDGPVSEAQRLAGSHVQIVRCLLHPAAPGRSLRSLLAHMPDATLVIPIGGGTRTPWYDEACRESDAAPRTMLFFLTLRDLEPAGFGGGRPRWWRRLLDRFGAIGARLRPRHSAIDGQVRPDRTIGRFPRSTHRRSMAGTHARRPGTQVSTTERSETPGTHGE